MPKLKASDPAKKKVLVALSGGVDSAVSAALLKDQGYQIEGAHMVCWNEGSYCTSDEDRSSAAKVAASLSIPFQVFDFRKQYREEVINYFFSEYEAGRTPNPDVACNKEIKFGIFLKKALELGFDYIATGHYVRVEKQQVSSSKYLDKNKDQSLAKFKLCAGLDPAKDQSYFLYNLTQEQLSHTLFPIGHLMKSEARQIAAKLNLPNATRKDSQGICFIGDVEIKEFLRQKIEIKIGNVVNQEGKLLGRHQGLAFYTIGQREGVGVSKNIPHYVIEKKLKTNTLVVAPFGDEASFNKKLSAESVNWIGFPPAKGEKLSVRIRYRQPLVSARLSSIAQNSFDLTFIEGQKAVTSGQAVVLYRLDQVVGGGIIT